MPRCSCGGVEITCPRGCGCFCAGGIDCTRWCEPVQVEAAFERQAVSEGGVVRTITSADGTQKLVINSQALSAGGDFPLHAPQTQLRGCMQGATLESMALVLGALHGRTVTAPAARAKETVDERVSGTLEELAARFGLTVSDAAPTAP